MIIYASLATGKLLACSKGVIEIQYEEQYSFNKLRLEKEENRKVVNEVFSEVLRENVKVKYLVEHKEKEGKSTEDLLIETFGDGIVEVLD